MPSIRETMRQSRLAGVIRPYWRAHLKRQADIRAARLAKTDFWKFSDVDNEFVTLYRQFMDPGDLVFDVGANIGIRSKVFVKLGARVVAFEPQPSCIARIKTVFDDRPDFTLVETALGAVDGEMEMLVSNVPGLSSLSVDYVERTKSRFDSHIAWAAREKVRITTLDAAIQKYGRPAFIKIDVEGFELEVLRGLSHMVQSLSIEFTAECIDKTLDALDYLAGLGPFEGQVLFDDSMTWKLDRWQAHAELADSLKELVERHSRCIGDVYIRRVPGR